MVDGNKLGDIGFKYLGVPYSQMDCQKFVEQCLKDCGCNKDLAGSNAWYREVMNHGRILTPEECVKELGCVPKGAFLFIHAFDGGEPSKYTDGLGNASHIGLCTMPKGEGAIHSSSSRGCVAESKFKAKSINGGWNKVGLWDQVSYDYGGGGTPAPEPEPEPLPEPDTATVFAENGKPVNLRKKASKLSALVDRVPCGDTVEVLSYDFDWSKIRWNKKTGYMMSCFLLFEDDDTDRYTVRIPNLTMEEIKILMDHFPDLEIV